MPAAGSYRSRSALGDEHAGRRGLCEEKLFMTELSKLFHVVKAQHAERRNRRHAAHTAAAAAAASDEAKVNKARDKKKAAHDSKQPTAHARRASRRISTAGGSVWMMLKGGFAQVPLSSQTQRVAHKAAVRAQLSARARVTALERAEAYVQSAWQQARDAGLVVTQSARTGTAAAAADEEEDDTTVSEEGAQYLREQYAVAASMLQPAPVGTRLRQLVHEHSYSNNKSSSSAATAATTLTDDALQEACRHAVPGRRRQQQQQHKQPLMSREAWHDVWRREYVIQHALYTHDAQAQAEHALRAALAAHDDAVVSPDEAYYFAVAEPSASQQQQQQQQHEHGSSSAPAAATNDIHDDCSQRNDVVVPSRCIVRIRNSQRMKRTTVLHKAKDINHFVSNVMQVLRRELASSRLPRGPAESLADDANNNNNTAAAPAAQQQQQQHVDVAATLTAQQQQQQQKGGGNARNSNNARRRR